MSHPNILSQEDALLVVVDVQDSLLKVIHDSELVVANCVRLIEAAKVFSIPILVTLQYSAKLGGCTKAIDDVLPHTDRIDKMTFSCCGSPEFKDMLSMIGRKQVILCGIETHVCVNQTAHDLLADGYAVHVVKDAVSSRTVENKIAGLNKMRDSGCIITSTEMAIFELTRDASSNEFKRILPIVK